MIQGIGCEAGSAAMDVSGDTGNAVSHGREQSTCPSQAF